MERKKKKHCDNAAVHCLQTLLSYDHLDTDSSRPTCCSQRRARLLSAADNRVGAVSRCSGGGGNPQESEPLHCVTHHSIKSSKPDDNERKRRGGRGYSKKPISVLRDRPTRERGRAREREWDGKKTGRGKKGKEERKSCRVFVEKSLNETRRRRWLVGGGGGKHAED